MAVQQNRMTRSKRDMRRSHDALTASTLSTDTETGERLDDLYRVHGFTYTEE